MSILDNINENILAIDKVQIRIILTIYNEIIHNLTFFLLY